MSDDIEDQDEYYDQMMELIQYSGGYANSGSGGSNYYSSVPNYSIYGGNMVGTNTVTDSQDVLPRMDIDFEVVTKLVAGAEKEIAELNSQYDYDDSLRDRMIRDIQANAFSAISSFLASK